MTYFLFLCLSPYLLPAEGQSLGTKENEEVMRCFKLCVNIQEPSFKTATPRGPHSSVPIQPYQAPSLPNPPRDLAWAFDSKTQSSRLYLQIDFFILSN